MSFELEVEEQTATDCEGDENENAELREMRWMQGDWLQEAAEIFNSPIILI